MNQTQRYVDRVLGNGASNRLDYSAHLPTSRPRSLQEFDALRRDAHADGPGSQSWSEYHFWLQNGMDRDGLPDAAGGGIPRSIGETGLEMQGAIAGSQQYFSRNMIDPILLDHGWQGRSFADWGPEATASIVALQMSEALPHERATWALVDQAMRNSPTTSLGIDYEAQEVGLQWHAPGADDNAADPSGYAKWFNSMNQEGERNGLAALAMRGANDDPALFGLDMASIGAGGGVWHADLQRAQESVANGLAMHQGDASLDVISQQ